MAKMSKAIRPMPIIHPNIHIGHIIQPGPPIPPIIPPLTANIAMSAMMSAPAMIKTIVNVVLDIKCYLPNGEARGASVITAKVTTNAPTK
jgi:hypothetical protein